MRVRYRAQALADLDNIARYQERSPQGAQNVLGAIYQSISDIAKRPESNARTDDKSVRVKLVRRYRFKIFYTAIEGTIEVLHVRHSARRPLA